MLVSVLFAACGDNRASIDGAVPVDSGPCWSTDGTTPTGTAKLGTGRASFMTMPDPVPIEYGAQDGYDVVGNVKMTGLDPGNSHDLLDPTNPKTRMLAYFVDTNVPLQDGAMCPYKYPYALASDGSYSFADGGFGIVFDTCWRSDNLIGKQIRIDLEIVDHNGGYANDSVTVTLAAPTGYYPMESSSPGCMH